MKLSIKEISSLLLLPEKEIHKMVRGKAIPHQIVQDKLWFNKQQIIEWALSRSQPLNLSGDSKFEEFAVQSIVPLINGASFFYECNFTEKSYIEQMVQMAALEPGIDRDVVVQLLRNREQLMSTAIGNGISLPHPRIPLVLGRTKPLIHCYFSNRSLNLNSIDKKPVHTLILIISQTTKQHLSLLAHISYLLSREEFRVALEKRLPAIDIIRLISNLEKKRKQ